MMWEEVSRINCATDVKTNWHGLWKALEVWIQKPHVLNRRLCGTKILLRKKLLPGQSSQLTHVVLQSLINVQETIGKFWNENNGVITQKGTEIVQKLAQFRQKEDLEDCYQTTGIECHRTVPIIENKVNIRRNDEEEDLSQIHVDGNKGASESSDVRSKPVEVLSSSLENNAEIILRLLLPKKETHYASTLEFILLDPGQCQAWFIPVCMIQSDHAENESTDHHGDASVCVQGLSYRISLSDDEETPSLVLHCMKPGTVKDEPSVVCLGCSESWLKEQLLPRLVHWSGQEGLDTSPSTLQLVDIARYYYFYQKLKTKYGPRLVEIWPERTDPKKFVYEDIAIAAYLMALWEVEEKEKKLDGKQSFVDLGCGNGLLVYLLSAEGYRGLGLDVRRRKIWDLFGEAADLREIPITPSDTSLFPDRDWLIGNHSDELTPWIPVIAARSSYTCQYFVLPCCPYDFHGKFGERQSGASQYRSYLQFVESVGKQCGFHVSKDIMRIPSTKRTCFIGHSRTYKKAEEPKQDALRTDFILQRQKFHNSMTKGKAGIPSEHLDGHDSGSPSVVECKENPCKKIKMTHPCDDHQATHDAANSLSVVQCSKGESPGMSHHKDINPAGDEFESIQRLSETVVKDIDIKNDSNSGPASSNCQSERWVKNFEARSSQEKVRNCTKVDRSLRDTIIHKVFHAVLECDPAAVVEMSDRSWRKGGNLSLGSVAAMFDADVLKQLKNECGGLQTLLRNQHQVFRVQGGIVKLRDWMSEENEKPRPRKKGRKLEEPGQSKKTKMCWFYMHHPDGCPQIDQNCNFAHGEDDLTVKQNKTKPDLYL